MLHPRRQNGFLYENEEVIVRPNIRVQKYVCQYLNELTAELKRLEKIEQTNDVLDNRKYLLELITRLSK